jgi:hypothetical protein
MPEKQNRSFDQASLTLTLSNPSTHPLSHHLQAHTWIGKYLRRDANDCPDEAVMAPRHAHPFGVKMKSQRDLN